MATEAKPDSISEVVTARWFNLSRGLNRAYNLPELQLRLDFECTVSRKIEELWREYPVLSPIREFSSDKYPVITLENFEGLSLKTIIELELVEAEQALGILRQIANGLDAMHASGLTHGGLKPSSILVADSGEARIVDWAVGWDCVPLAYLTDSADYLAPEQLAKHRADRRCDQFALAVIAHQLLEGRYPFPGGPAERLFRINFGLPDQEIIGETSFAVRAIYERAFSVNPDLRFESCAAMICELETIPKRRAYSETRLVDIHDGQEGLPDEIPGIKEVDEWVETRRPSGWWTLAAGFALLALALSVLNWKTQSHLDALVAQTAHISRESALDSLGNGSLNVCNVSSQPLTISELSAAYWNDQQKLQVFTSPSNQQSGWVVEPGSSTSLKWPQGAGSIWNGSVLFYFIRVRQGDKEFVVSGRWDSSSQGCLHLA